jgi:hypothetical protein
MEHRNHRLSRRSLALAGFSAVLIGMVALGLTLTGGSGPVRASLAASTASSTATSAPTTTTTSAPTTTTTQAQPGSPAATDPFSPASVCAAQPNFFTPAGRATIFHDFGGEVGPCLFFPAADAWVTPANGIPGFPAGDALLVDRCAKGDAACASASTPHPLASFTAYPAPDPRAYQLQFLMPSSDPGGGLLSILDGRCASPVFDVANGIWYGGSGWSAVYAADSVPASQPRLPAGQPYNMSTTPLPPSGTVPPSCDLQGPGIR